MDHSFVFLLLALSLVLTAAKIGGLAARFLHLPEVLGELFAGVLLGNMSALGFGFFEQIRMDPSLATLAELGAIILMFEVGVESTVRKLLEVGWNSMAVAILGVILPFFLGFAVTRLFFPHLSIWVNIFLGATLCATSVGISARVLKDLGKVQSLEGRTILGAAVADDVLGLIVLAGVVAMIGSTASPGLGDSGITEKMLLIFFKAFAFLAAGILLGSIFSKSLYRWAAKLRSSGMLLTLSLTFCFAFAFLAQQFGLASIIGAFAAGLVLEPEHSLIFREQEKEPLERLIVPLATVFVPIFFFHIGMQVSIGALLSLDTLILGLVLSAAAIVGKMACAAGILFNRGSMDRWSIAIGMVPRGEVGLIFAGMGATLKIGGVPLLGPGLYAAVILMVFITTAITPPLLVRRLSRS